jgi:hypothetical protein
MRRIGQLEQTDVPPPTDEARKPLAKMKYTLQGGKGRYLVQVQFRPGNFDG